VNPANVTSSGSLVRASSRNGVAIYAGPGLKPGQGQRAEVTIVNLGALPAAFRLRETGPSPGFAPGRLGFAIHELGEQASRRLFLGEIGGVPAEGIDLGRFEAGESRTYRFTVMLAKDTPAEELDRAASAVYEWLAAAAGGR
jgi:spore coat-associated protein N